MIKAGNWTQISLEGPILSGALDGLIGIEELKDYDLDTVIKAKSKSRLKKRILSETEEITPKKIKVTENTSKINDIKSSPGAFVKNPNFSPKKTEIVSQNGTENDKSGIITKKTKKKSKKKRKAKQNSETNITESENGEEMTEIVSQNGTESDKSDTITKKKPKKKSKKKRKAKQNSETNITESENREEITETVSQNGTESDKSDTITKKKPKKKSKKKSKAKQNNETNITENGEEIVANPAKKKKKKPTKIKNNTEIGVKINTTETDNKLTVEDLKAWDLVSLPEPIIKAIAELGFAKPSEIQELTLPPAMLGRRDILGAAETGSGKTLAFGLPILTGILDIKAKENESDNEKILKNMELDDEDGNDNDEDGNDDDEDGNDDDEDGNDDDEDANDDDEDGNDDDEDANDDDEEEEFNLTPDSSEVEDEIDENGTLPRLPLSNVNQAEDASVSNFSTSGNCKRKHKPLYALVLTPTRELAVQVKNHLEAVAKYTGIHVAVVVGGMAAVKQERILAHGPEIVVATPGRLWELIQLGNAHLSQIDNIRYLAIDETDRMLEHGHFDELHQLLERLNMNESKRQQRQNFVFSATLTLVHDLPTHLLAKKRLNAKKSKRIIKLTPQQKLQKIIQMLGISDPKIIDITKERGTAQNLTECRITCAIEEKDFYVYYFLKKHPGRTLIFCNSIGCVKRLATLLGLLGCGALPLHASMVQRQRLKNLERFRDNRYGVLVSTDVAARGLDIPSVEHVLHYQTPRTVESYVHRSGRTARALELGITVLLIEPSEIIDYRKLCQTLNRTEDLPAFPVEERYLNAVKQIVKIARELDKLELKTKRVNSEIGWLQKAAEEMDMIIDRVEDSDNEELNESAKLKRKASVLRKQLTALLAKPVTPRNISFKYPLMQNMPIIQSEEPQISAIDVMKKEMEILKKKKITRKLFKPKPTIAERKADKKATKESEKRRKRKIKKDKFTRQSSKLSDDEQ